MTTNDQEASSEVAIVDKVETAAVVQIATTSKEKLNEMEKLKRSLNSKKSVTTRSLKKTVNSGRNFPRIIGKK